MTYSALLSEEGIQSNYLVVLQPRRKVTGFTLDSGSVYYLDFDHGEVIGVTQNGVELTLGANSVLSAGQFFYDTTLSRLFVRMSDSSNPSTKFVVASYEIYCGTTDSHWYRVPTDSATRVVYFDPLVIKAPELKSTTSDTLFGYLPIQSSTLQLNNAEHVLERHIYDSSFNRAPIKVYHWLESLSIANISLVYDGLCGDIVYTGEKVSIKTTDRTDEFTTEWRNAGDSFFSTSTFAELDPSKVGRPIRYVYGVVDGFVPVNIDYKASNDSPTTSDNRIFVCIGEQTSLNEITRTVSASPASTATRTYVDSAAGFLVGDSVWLDRAVGTDEYKIVTQVVYTSNPYIEHSALSGGAMASGDSVKRSFVGNLTIVQNNVKYQPLYGRDYVSSVGLAGTTAGFTLQTSMEANLSMPSTFTPNDRIYARVYGRKNNVTLGGPALGSNDAYSDNLTHPVVIMVDILKRVLGLPESKLNTSAWSALVTGSEAIGIAIPENVTENFKSVKETLLRLMETTLIKLYLDSDSKWKPVRIAPMGSVTKSIDDTEILDGTFDSAFQYKEIISDVAVNYARREVSNDVAVSGESFSSVTASSNTALYLHKTKKQKTFESLHFRSVDAQTLANRLSYIFGEREGNASLKTKNRFFDTLINDVIQVSRTKLPGFSFVETTEQTRSFSTVELSKDLRSIDLSLSDNKGIEDNSGSW